MTKRIRRILKVVLPTLALAVGLFTVRTHVVASAPAPFQHVLLLSIDGLHASDLDWYVSHFPNSTLAALSATGRTYTHATATKPSDSFPGMLAMITGGTPRSTGVYYDDGWDRTLAAAGTSLPCAAGTRVRWKQNLDITYPSFSIFDDYAAFWTGIAQPASPLNPNLLPRDPANGCSKFFPNMFPRVNNVFEVIKIAGARTAWSDKHPAYEFVRGPSWTGPLDDLDVDLYTPEIATNIGSAPSPTTSPLTAVITDNFQLTMNYDDLKVDAILKEIAGFDHTGVKSVGMPALFGMNFQAVSVGQKLDMSSVDGLSGGYDDTLLPTQPLIDALAHTDASIGRMVAALDQYGVRDSTLIIVSAKHGNSPIDRSTLVRIDPAWITNIIECNSTLRNSSCVPLVAQLSADTGPLLWLKDQSKTAAVVATLDANRRTLRINGGPGEGILSGDAITAMFANPLTDARAPDIILQPVPGTVYVAQSSFKDPVTGITTFLGWSKIADHGGFYDDDTHVGLLVSSSRFRREVVDQPVETRQIACTTLEMLGLDCGALQSQAIEPSTSLPHDITPPVITVPSAMTVEAAGPTGSIATFTVSATDPDDAVAGSIDCSPASGSTFAITTTTVTCTASDTHGNTGTNMFTVSVVDTTPPALTSTANVVSEATSSLGAVVSYSAPTAADVVDGPVPVSCAPASGSQFPVGNTTVTCSASDLHGNKGSVTLTVTVSDTTPPTLNLVDVIVDATSLSGAVVDYSAKETAIDLVDGPVALSCSPASGSLFPVGTTTVACIATDKHGNSQTDTFSVAVFLSPAQMVESLIDAMGDNLRQAQNLLQKTIASLNKGNINAACGKLGAFINQVQAQSNKSLKAADAATLIGQATAVRAALVCK